MEAIIRSTRPRARDLEVVPSQGRAKGVNHGCHDVSQQPMKRKPHTLFVMLAMLFAAWIVTAMLARGFARWQIQLTNVGFALSLVMTYVAGWVIAAMVSRAPRRRTLFRAIASSIILVIVLLMLELPAFIGIVDYAYLWNHVTGDWSGPTTNFTTDTVLGFGRPAHQRWYGQPRSDMAVTWNLPIRSPRPISFSTDARGFRNREDRSEADIVLIGDSYIEGAYVSDDETAAVRLEELARVPVMNLGRAGYGTLQEFEVLNRTALPMRPRMIAWFFYEGNDLYNDQEFTEAITYLREHGTYVPAGSIDINWDSFRRASLSANMFRLARRVLDPLVPNRVATMAEFRDADGNIHTMYFYDDASVSFGQFEQQQLERATQSFQRGAELCKEAGTSLILIHIPTKFRVYRDFCTFPAQSPCLDWEPWDVPERLRAYCAKAEIPFLDLTVTMREAAEQGRVLYAPEDSHWCSRGQEFVAELLFREWQRVNTRQE